MAARAVKHLVVTTVLTEEIECILPYTLPRQRRYALRIGADYMVRGVARPDLESYWQRLTVAELFDQYERMIVLDADTLIRGDCPDLFDLVPPEKVGMAAEAFKWNQEDRRDSIHDYYRHYGLEWPGDENWDGMHYYNIGVWVVSREHRALMEIPEDGWHGRCNEQCLVTGRLMEWGWPVEELGYRFNFMPRYLREPGYPKTQQEAYIAHYASGEPFEKRFPQIAADDAAWKGRGL